MIIKSTFFPSNRHDHRSSQRVHEIIVYHELLEDLTENNVEFGRDHNPKFLFGIADLRDGNFHFVTEFNTVNEVFMNCQ